MNDPQLDAQILQWLGQVDTHLQQTLLRETPNLYLAAAEPLDGQPLDSAICAHLAWRERLEELFAREATSELDAATVGQDDLCAIGRWLHGDGARRFSKLPEFAALRARHASFHEKVSHIVRTAQQGDVDGARATLDSPEYADDSWQVVNAIAALARVIGPAAAR